MTGFKLNLLGGFEAALDEGAPLVFDTDKDRALFIYMVLAANHPIRRESLAGLFWPEKSEGIARHNLSQAIYSLRKQFQGKFASDPFEVTPQTLLFRVKDPSGFDFYRFDQMIQGCIQHWANPDLTCKVCLSQLELACTNYQGNFCAGLSLKECNNFEEWICLQREIYSLKFSKIIDILVQGLCQRGDLEDALIYAYKKIFQDPYDESSQLQVIQVLVQLGQRNKARERFEAYSRMMSSELFTSPSKEMIDSYEILLSMP
jgi:DNA-binding SARP family transcriptional activator